jgi:hypothetical protein
MACGARMPCSLAHQPDGPEVCTVCRRMQIKRELKAPAEKPAEPAAAAEPLDSEEEAETREAAVLEEMQVMLDQGRPTSYHCRTALRMTPAVD